MPSNKKLTYAERAERYAEKCANKEIEVPAQVSKAYTKWFAYKKKHEFKPEHLTRTCQLIENALPPTDDGKRLELPDWCCALLSWPLVFVKTKNERVINELHVRAKPKIDISLLMAGLMVAELDAPFRNSYHKGALYCPSPVIIATGKSARLARPLFDKALLILSRNPAFRENCGIPSRKTLVESKKSNGAIKICSMKSSAFAYGHETAVFLDDFILANDVARLMSKARTEMEGNMNPNFLLVTNGASERKPRYAFSPVEEEIKRRKRSEQTMGNRVDLCY